MAHSLYVLYEEIACAKYLYHLFVGKLFPFPISDSIYVCLFSADHIMFSVKILSLYESLAEEVLSYYFKKFSVILVLSSLVHFSQKQVILS